jgi:ankyrin repeat protein
MDRIIKLLLTKYSVDPNVKGENGWTAMHIAAINDYPKIIRHLLDNRGSLSEQDDNGWAPIHLAALSGKAASVSSFIRLGVDVNVKGRYDWTPLFNAASKGRESVVDLLLKKHANANTKDIYGKTSLDYARKNLDNYLSYKNDNSIEAANDAVEQRYNLTITTLKKYMKQEEGDL